MMDGEGRIPGSEETVKGGRREEEGGGMAGRKEGKKERSKTGREKGGAEERRRKFGGYSLDEPSFQAREARECARAYHRPSVCKLRMNK